MTKRVISAMRATGGVHVGNYYGAIIQFQQLQALSNECFYFVADLHALTEVAGVIDIDSVSVEVAKHYLACLLGPPNSILYRQSDVPEVSQMAVLLGNIVSLGRLRTCTTFKDRVRNRGLAEGEVSYGLLGYPVLMSADILSVRADCVPVGQDQIQHVEMTRDFARAFNRTFGRDVFTIPEVNLQDAVRVPGIDGSEKMGKSDGNTIRLLDDPESVRSKILGIPTQAEPGGDMTKGTRALYKLMELCSPKEIYEQYVERYQRQDGKFFGEMKRRLAEDVVALLQPIQDRYRVLRDDEVREVLASGSRTVRQIAAEVLDDMCSAIGLTSGNRGV
jgi:tryptophanyl-tRNA synthetase